MGQVNANMFYWHHKHVIKEYETERSHKVSAWEQENWLIRSHRAGNAFLANEKQLVMMAG